MNFGAIKNPTSSNEITRAYFDSILVESRYLDSCEPDTEMELFGKKFASPIMIAAFSHLHNQHEGGMVEMAKGAKAAGICNWAGMGPKEELTEILATGCETIKIVKPYADRNKVFDMIKHAETSGALAVGVDIDHSFNWKGNNDVVLGEAMKPVTSQELAEFVSATKLPFVIKGVMSVQDAVKCAQAGVKGLLISHHSGILPCAVPPLMALPAIKDAVGNDIDLFVDCNVNSGFDAFKCLAMGAKAVCVGRAILPSFKESGAAGVEKYIANMNDELKNLMAKTGCYNLSKMTKTVLWNGETEERF